MDADAIIGLVIFVFGFVIAPILKLYDYHKKKYWAFFSQDVVNRDSLLEALNDEFHLLETLKYKKDSGEGYSRLFYDLEKVIKITKKYRKPDDYNCWYSR